jgi:methyl-accepting chemotaxis protein
MSDITEVFNGIMADLEDTVARIRTFADEVEESIDEVTAGTTESQRGSEEVSESIQEVN